MIDSIFWFKIAGLIVVIAIAIWTRTTLRKARLREQEQQKRLGELTDECYATHCRIEALRAFQHRCAGCINGDSGLLAVYARVRAALADTPNAREIEKAANFLLNMAAARGLSKGGAWQMPAPKDTPDYSREAFVQLIGKGLDEEELIVRLASRRRSLAEAEHDTRMSDALAEWLVPAGDFAAQADDTAATPDVLIAAARTFINVSSKIIEKYGFEV